MNMNNLTGFIPWRRSLLFPLGSNTSRQASCVAPATNSLTPCSLLVFWASAVNVGIGWMITRQKAAPEINEANKSAGKPGSDVTLALWEARNHPASAPLNHSDYPGERIRPHPSFLFSQSPLRPSSPPWLQRRMTLDLLLAPVTGALSLPQKNLSRRQRRVTVKQIRRSPCQAGMIWSETASTKPRKRKWEMTQI